MIEYVECGWDEFNCEQYGNTSACHYDTIRDEYEANEELSRPKGYAVSCAVPVQWDPGWVVILASYLQ